MQGYHKVKEFFHYPEGEIALPVGWKPFGYNPETGKILARKWERLEEDVRTDA